MNDILNLLGLIYRARKMVLGEEILNQIRSVKLLILAEDISEKSSIRYEKKCHYYQIRCISIFNSSQLSEALGKNNVKAIGITDKGFAETLLNKLKEGYHGKTDL